MNKIVLGTDSVNLFKMIEPDRFFVIIKFNVALSSIIYRSPIKVSFVKLILLKLLAASLKH